MWVIEIGYTYTNYISRLVYETREQAEVERNKLLPFIGKDRYDLKQNTSIMAITISDIYGIIDVVVTDVKVLRLYDINKWESDAIRWRKELKAKEEEKGIDDGK